MTVLFIALGSISCDKDDNATTTTTGAHVVYSIQVRQKPATVG
jgi:hypothetical protein